MKSLYEQLGGTYTPGADGIYYPNRSLPENKGPWYGKYGRMRLTYPWEHRKAHYTTLLFNNTLTVFVVIGFTRTPFVIPRS